MIDKLLTASANTPHDWLENTSHRPLFASACFLHQAGSPQSHSIQRCLTSYLGRPWLASQVASVMSDGWSASSPIHSGIIHNSSVVSGGALMTESGYISLVDWLWLVSLFGLITSVNFGDEPCLWLCAGLSYSILLRMYLVPVKETMLLGRPKCWTWKKRNLGH